MSIMIASNDNFYGTMETISNLNGMWRTKAYLGGTSQGQLNSQRLETLLNELYNMNICCYNNRYKENYLHGQPSQNPNKISELQALKTLQCLRYNIEKDYLTGYQISIYKDYFNELHKIETVEDVLNVLNIIIDELKDVIISNLEEYKNAEWGE